jgi:hypothetical protein
LPDAVFRRWARRDGVNAARLSHRKPLSGRPQCINA